MNSLAYEGLKGLMQYILPQLAPFLALKNRSAPNKFSIKHSGFITNVKLSIDQRGETQGVIFLIYTQLTSLTSKATFKQ